MYYIIWSYRIDQGKQAQFEKEYSRNGTWFKFFEECDDYLGTELIKNNDDGSYLLIDKWISKETYDRFVSDNSPKYNELNDHLQNLYAIESRVGEYTTL